MGCLLYADDIVLLLASFIILQLMLDNFTFNVIKLLTLYLMLIRLLYSLFVNTIIPAD